MTNMKPNASAAFVKSTPALPIPASKQSTKIAWTGAVSPRLKLVFDTANPVFQLDRSKPQADGSFPWQDPLEFYQKVKEHIIHVHIKDCTNPPIGESEPAAYTLPGDGQAKVREILNVLKADGYTGGLAIEPHVATVFHATNGQEPDWQQCYDSYVEYGQAMNKIIEEIS